MTRGSKSDVDVGKPGVSGYFGVAISAGEINRDGPPPYKRAMQILWEKQG